MAFDSKVEISINRDVILVGDFFFDPVEGKNKAKKRIKDDQGGDIPVLRSDFKMSDSEKINHDSK